MTTRRKKALARQPSSAVAKQPSLGLILCLEKNETHVEYALGGLSNQVFVSKYLLHLPPKEDLEAFLQRTRKRLEAAK